jgi:hypothetical protein
MLKGKIAVVASFLRVSEASHKMRFQPPATHGRENLTSSKKQRLVRYCFVSLGYGAKDNRLLLYRQPITSCILTNEA